MFIMRRVGRREVVADGDMTVVDAFNAVHADCRVKVEWGIGGLKSKWRRLMKKFEAKQEKFVYLFTAAAILMNFLHPATTIGKRLLSEMEVAGWAIIDIFANLIQQ
jgi:hypothetical protein